LRIPLAILLVLLLILTAAETQAQDRQLIDLNGAWEFDQTESAFPPQRFTRKIPVPGLVFLAQPKIDQYDSYYDGTYKPRYNWYRKTFTVPADLQGREAVITLLKSKYVTQAYLNGKDLGRSVSCYTPVEFPAGDAIRFGEQNELLVCVGDRKWLPSQAAGSTDKEKVTYWPGIWDDVFVSFTGALRARRALVLPSSKDGKVVVKAQVRSFAPAQTRYGDPMSDSCLVQVEVVARRGVKVTGGPARRWIEAKRDNITLVRLEIPIEEPHLWTPEDPFLYTAKITVKDAAGKISDTIDRHFGLRDFSRDGRHFTLNGQKTYLRGTNVTLHRFFEDPDCGALPWDRRWVKKLLAEIPKSVGWNAMRICVGIAPSFWYDVADESGLLLQNEWLYWQNHGWDEQIRTEYTDWVWADGSHPSIVIWDAINENWDDYVGNRLIPELKELDPTRIWDAGYMTARDMALDEMDEPHPYVMWNHRTGYNDSEGDPPYPLGDLNYWLEDNRDMLTSQAAQLVNEYGWVWLWRDGTPAILTTDLYRYYLGNDATARQRMEFQAYWVQLQTEWLRAERSLAGVLAFCYLTDNLGFTGDWFTDAATLTPTPTLKWFRHCFAPTAVFINLTDGRYIRDTRAFRPGESATIELVGVNDLPTEVRGRVSLELLDSQNSVRVSHAGQISIPAYGKSSLPVEVEMPSVAGGYLVLCRFTREGSRAGTVFSRRYIRVGNAERPLDYYEFGPE
jgi:beta-galactosidase